MQQLNMQIALPLQGMHVLLTAIQDILSMICFCYERAESHDMAYSEKAATNSDTSLTRQYPRRSILPFDYRCPIDLKPSIAAVEKVAAAKSAIELQYKSLLYEKSPRQLRRQTLERELAWQGLSYDQRCIARKA